MDSIDHDTLVKAGEMIAVLDRTEIGDIHTVTLTVDNHTGECRVRVESAAAGDILLLIQ